LTRVNKNGNNRLVRFQINTVLVQCISFCSTLPTRSYAYIARPSVTVHPPNKQVKDKNKGIITKINITDIRGILNEEPEFKTRTYMNITDSISGKVLPQFS
jgi:hypothetical protein